MNVIRPRAAFAIVVAASSVVTAQREPARPVDSCALRLVTGPKIRVDSAIARNATATVTLQPVAPKTIPASSYPPGSTIVGQTLTMPTVPSGGQLVWFEVLITGWAPQVLETAQARFSATGLAGANAFCGWGSGGADLEIAQIPCVADVDCRATMSGLVDACGVGEPSRCRTGSGSYLPWFPPGSYCDPAFLDRCDGEWIGIGVSHIAAVDTSTPNIRWGFRADPGETPLDFGSSYLGTLVINVPPGAKGTYTLDFVESETFMQELLSSSLETTPIPIAALNPGVISIPCGKCCYGVQTPAAGCEDGMSQSECGEQAAPSFFTANEVCWDPPSASGCCECLTNAECNDNDACTTDICDRCVCSNFPKVSWDQQYECCDPATGTETALGCVDQCEAAFCTLAGNHGTAQCLPRTGERCDDDNPCTYGDICVGDADSCAGIDAATVECVTAADCETVTGMFLPCRDEHCDCGFFDCNGNGISDFLDIALHTSEDCNESGVPDECELRLAGFALYFDGSQDFVRVPRDPSLEPGEYTIEMWAYLDGSQTRNTRLLRKASSPNGYIFAADQDVDRRMQLRQHNPNLVAAKDVQDHAGYAGAWHHFAGTYAVDEIRFYVDGQLVSAVPHTAGPAKHTTIDLYIGHGFPSGDPDEHFKGMIDEVRIWNVVQSEARIRQNMSRAVRPDEPGLVSYWRFDEGQGQTLHDATASAKHGVLGTSDEPVGDVSDPQWVVSELPFHFGDCNENGVLDECDIASGASDDCNKDGVPDECSLNPQDCNENDVLDECDLAQATSDDCDGDGVPDECQLDDNDYNRNGIPDNCEPDCNRNGMPDDRDLEDGTSDDCNENEIPDDCEADCNASGVPDDCDVANGTSDDCNENDVPDECEMSTDGYALSFDGSQDYVRVPRDASLEPQRITIELWAYLDGAQTRNTRLLRKAPHFSGTRSGYFLAADQDTDRRMQLRVHNPDLVAAKDVQDHAAYAGAWHHFAGTYDEGEAKFYVDGTCVHAALHDNGLMAHDPVTDLFIGHGAPSTDGSEHFRGYIDEVRLWDYVRSGQQIEANINRPLGGNEPGLIAYWRFDEGEGQTAYDSSLHRNHGTLGANDSPGGDTSDPQWIVSELPFLFGDCNDNGVLDECDIASGASNDCNDNLVPDECELGGTTDCNRNGRPDLCDVADKTSPDCNASGMPDECELQDKDCNESGVPDECELGDNDCNDNAVPDECDLSGGFSDDCSGDGTPDECEPDADRDGIPDSCDGFGDFDHDGRLDLADHYFLYVCHQFLSGPGIAPPWTECIEAFDSDDDWDVDMADLARFEAAFTGPQR